MSFVDELYSSNKTVPRIIWMREVHAMSHALQSKIKNEHANGKRCFSGYFSWLDGDCYLNDMQERLTIGGTCGSDYPLEEMAEALRDIIKELGFARFRVYLGTVKRYTMKPSFFGNRLRESADSASLAIMLDINW